MSAKERPIIAITMGDAAGIGPEIIAKALLLKQIHSICRPFVIGDGIIMQGAIELINGPLKLRPVKSATEVKGQFGTIDLLDLQDNRRDGASGIPCPPYQYHRICHDVSYWPPPSCSSDYSSLPETGLRPGGQRESVSEAETDPRLFQSVGI